MIETVDYQLQEVTQPADLAHITFGTMKLTNREGASHNQQYEIDLVEKAKMLR